MFLYGSVRFFSINVLITSLKPHNSLFVGGVAEWSNAPVLKLDNYPLIVSHAIKNTGLIRH